MALGGGAGDRVERDLGVAGDGTGFLVQRGLPDGQTEGVFDVNGVLTVLERVLDVVAIRIIVLVVIVIVIVSADAGGMFIVVESVVFVLVMVIQIIASASVSKAGDGVAFLVVVKVAVVLGVNAAAMLEPASVEAGTLPAEAPRPAKKSWLAPA